MTITIAHHRFNVYLEDDGTLDTVLSVSPVNQDLWARYGSSQIRFDCEYAASCRRKNGEMTAAGFKRLAEEAVESYLEIHEIE